MTAPLFVLFNVAFCVIGAKLRSLPRPTAGIAGPPRFVVPGRGAQRKLKRIWFVVRTGDMVLALFPGVLAALRGNADIAARTGLVGWGAFTALWFVEPRSLLMWPLVFAYWWSFSTQMSATNGDDDAGERFVGWMRATDEAMVRAECELPSCPRCRQADRDATGWCSACRAMLSGGALSLDDWRARVGNRRALDVDGALYPRCATQMTRSYFGAGGEQYALTKRARETGLPSMIEPDGVVHEQSIEEAYADPKRPDLVWVRAREWVAYDAGDAYMRTRVEAWGFVDGLFAQAWVFAPISAGPPPRLASS